MNLTRMLCHRVVRSQDVFKGGTSGLIVPGRLTVLSTTRTGHSMLDYDFNSRIRASVALDANYPARRVMRVQVTGVTGWPRLGPVFTSHSEVGQQLWFELRLKRSRYYKEMARYSL